MAKLAPCPPLLLRVSVLFVFLQLFSSSSASDSIGGTGSVRDGETLLSAGGSFELGFFSPGGGSTKKYLCIRFSKGKEKPIVWVANRDHPLNDSTGVLKFGADGRNLVVADSAAGGVLWSTKVASNAPIGNRVAQLLDSGNLVVRDAGEDAVSGTFLWQSFDEPGDTLLPGMKLLLNTKTGFSRHLTSWKSPEDPSNGKYSYRVQVEKLPRLVLLEGSTVIRLSSGLWNGARFSGYPPYNANSFFTASVVSSGDETTYGDTVIGNSSSTLVRVLLESSGEIKRLVWKEETGKWSTLWWGPTLCERFDTCGPFGICTEGNFPYCRCLRGFRPRWPQEWSLGNGTGGCERKTKLDCGGGGDVFVRVEQVKLPELDGSSTVSLGMSLEECRERCAGDCSCAAYSSADVREGGRGCITWSGDLMDIRNFSINVQEFYLRVPASETEPTADDTQKNKRKRSAPVVVAASVSGGVLLVVALCGSCMMMKKRKTMMNRKREDDRDKKKHLSHVSVAGEDGDLPLLDFETIASSTNNFSLQNKVGEGGFGVVYKGILDDGQQVAVKRLSWSSVQGENEFMNEARLIAKLQHKNLVRLLGCCIQGEEKILIYEYMQNKSLDTYIFDESKHAILDWRIRLDIILGIARGLMYLHHDSRFTIIHRDIKASNILLDGAMNPKISDFGTARIFGADQNVEKTKRVVGTYGYMPPEYAMNGIISVKSDVFSFGVLTLEILSGIKNRWIYENEAQTNLLSHAWKLWQEGNCLELVDATMAISSNATQMMRCIQVALLCVQERSIDRPTMSTVVMMLASENHPLLRPKNPGFLFFRSCNSVEVPSSTKPELTENEMTITIIEGR